MSALLKRWKLSLVPAGVGDQVVIAANSISDKRACWRAWIWLCPWAMVGLAVVILFFVGLSIWTALLAAMMLVCPAIILWGANQTSRRKKT
jgi:hypothetical protein